jgi:hypothetical protein
MTNQKVLKEIPKNMNISLGTKRYLATAAILVVGLLCACTSHAATPTPPAKPPETPQVTTPSSKPSNTLDRVDVVYFHRPQRCPTCLCFEERIRYVVSTYFQNELDSGKMTFGVYNIGDSQNSAIVNKYGAVGSQLFINTVRDGTDNIKDIQDIWSWNCRGDKPGFDQQVRNLIQQSLDGD